MKPVLVVQHIASGGPGRFAEFAAARDLPLQLVRCHAGEALPTTTSGIAGLCILGGPQSANDSLPYLRAIENLIRQAIAAGQPVIGHCLGGQLMARALGGSVVRNTAPEIGWVPWQPSAAGAAWLGEAPPPIFQWHHDTFALPSGATALATSEGCANQAFVFDGRHLALQGHLEITPTIIDAWLADAGCQRDMARHAACPAVQDAATMRAATRDHGERAAALAMEVYARWAMQLQD